MNLLISIIVIKDKKVKMNVIETMNEIEKNDTIVIKNIKIMEIKNMEIKIEKKLVVEMRNLKEVKKNIYHPLVRLYHPRLLVLIN